VTVPPAGAQAGALVPAQEAGSGERPAAGVPARGGDGGACFHGLERLVRYCVRPPLSQERLGRLNDDHLVYRLRKPTLDGRTELFCRGRPGWTRGPRWIGAGEGDQGVADG